mmetsp:Transcript_31845/g.67846  ORF Transcript_31845/g.67846 Transcript_31845/m.67846 type:complete len:161 (+) Transcript_31845:186-668(+)
MAISSHADMAIEGFSPALISVSRGHDDALQSRRSILQPGDHRRSHSQRALPPIGPEYSPPERSTGGGGDQRWTRTDRRGEAFPELPRGGQIPEQHRRRRNGENEGEKPARPPPAGADRAGGRSGQRTRATMTAMTMTAGNDDAIVEVGRPFAGHHSGRWP